MPVYKMVDTCASEFKAYTPYLYSTYDGENENPVSKKKKAVILGGGPNRIGQGIEFDYCCVHSVYSPCAKMGYEVSMVNCNPETVSTDYDTSDKLYFEPLTMEDVMSIADEEGKEAGFIAQFGGQTPLKLAMPLYNKKVRIMGTSPVSIDIAEDRKKFDRILTKLDILQAGERYGFFLKGSLEDNPQARVPGACQALLCARRKGHGDSL